jgi:hypothetical protein
LIVTVDTDTARAVVGVLVAEAGRLLAKVPGEAWLALVAGAVLMALYVRVRRSPRPSRIVIMLGTVIGLGWSAQGMWDTAVHTYGVAVVIASVLFAMFEAFMVGAMMEAEFHRRDLARRRPWVVTVWTLAAVMALVVSLGEGWTQAPLRLSVPLVVALIWYRSLTADDDPALRQRTSLRWTPRRLALLVGAIEPGDRDERTINRDRLRDSMVRLAFRERYAPAWLASLTRTRIRRARLATDATDDDLAVVSARLDRARRVMARTELAPASPAAPAPPAAVRSAPLRLPAVLPPDRPQGVHVRDGRTMRGSELKQDAMDLVRARSLSGEPITNAELAALYDPPLGQRTAETYGAAGRKLALQNGSAV